MHEKENYDSEYIIFIESQCDSVTTLISALRYNTRSFAWLRLNAWFNKFMIVYNYQRFRT